LPGTFLIGATDTGAVFRNSEYFPPLRHSTINRKWLSWNYSVGGRRPPGGGERRRQPNFRRPGVSGHHLLSAVSPRKIGSTESFRLKLD
jgi:hypothetical protein